MINVPSDGLPSINTLKRLAKNLQKSLDCSLAEAQRHTARMFGYERWESLHASAPGSSSFDISQVKDSILTTYAQRLEIFRKELSKNQQSRARTISTGPIKRPFTPDFDVEGIIWEYLNNKDDQFLRDASNYFLRGYLGKPMPIAELIPNCPKSITLQPLLYLVAEELHARLHSDTFKLQLDSQQRPHQR